MRSYGRRCMLAGLLAMSAVSVVHAQSAGYPTKPVQVLADSAAGSASGSAGSSPR